MSAETLPPPPDSLFYKVRYTPLRDVLRGRLTARMDLDRLTSQSGLPPLLQESIRKTVRLTRLRWREKDDVTRELIAHFRDGLEAGQPPDALVRQFGDLAVAAKLIRRARQRNRSIYCRATVKTLKYAALLVAATYALLLVRFYSGTVRLSRSFLRELNAPILATPEHDRAWPIYRRAYLSTTPWPNGVRSESPASPDWPTVVQYVSENHEALRLYRDAAAKPAMGMVVSTSPDLEVQRHNQEFPERFVPPPPDKSDNPPIIGALLPNLSVMRFGSRMLRIDALDAADKGDGPRVLADISAMLAMADQCTQQKPLMADLVSIAIMAQAAGAMSEILNRNPDALDDAAWIGLSHRLAAARGGILRMRLEGERAYFEDVLQRTYTDDGNGDGHLRPGKEQFFGIPNDPPCESVASFVAVGPVFSAIVAGRRDMQAKYNELAAMVEQEAGLPLWQRDASAADSEIGRLKTSNVQNAKFLFISLLFPSLSAANFLFEVTTQQRDATLVAIALELYRRKHGEYPPTLEALVPQYLPTVPPDRYDGNPLKYKLENGRPLLYSIGVDRKDDGGVLPKGQHRTSANWSAGSWVPPSQLPKPGPEYDKINGDWILWPPVED